MKTFTSVWCLLVCLTLSVRCESDEESPEVSGQGSFRPRKPLPMPPSIPDGVEPLPMLPPKNWPNRGWGCARCRRRCCKKSIAEVPQAEALPQDEVPQAEEMPTCDVCGNMRAGFNDTVKKLQEISMMASNCMPCSSGRIQVGDAALDTSVATCPEGLTVVSCRCNNADSTCRGAAIEGRTCSAFNAYDSTEPIYAMARCSVVKEGDFVVVTSPDVSTDGFSSNPLATCPGTHQISGCISYSLGDESQKLQELVQTEIDVTAGTCTPTKPCSIGLGCSVQALCWRKPEPQ